MTRTEDAWRTRIGEKDEEIARLRAELKAVRGVATTQLFHDIWAYAKERPDEHTRGYDKGAFMYVNYWLQIRAPKPNPPA